MKKVLLALSLLLVVGGGCVSLGKITGQKQVEGKWSLAFDLPADWIMAVPYQSPNTEAVTLSQEVDREDNEIYLQSTNTVIVLGGIKPNDDVPAESYTTLDGQTLIKVSRLDPRRVVPSEAEDLGHDFFKVKLCETGEDCQLGGRLNYDYYLKTTDTNYKFVVYGTDLKQAENIILSAQVTAVPNAVTE